MATENRHSFPVVGDYGKESFAVLGSERTVNMYIVDMPASHWGNPAKSAGLVKWPGSLEVEEIVGKTGGREFFVNKVLQNEAYFVVEDKVYKLDINLLATEIGTLGTTTGPVGIDQNQTQVIFVDGTGGWVYTWGTSTFSTISDLQFPSGATDVVAFDGYAVVTEDGTNQVHISTVNDFTSWSGAAFGITSKPDTVVAVGAINRNLVVFGHQSTELWYDSGQAEFTNSVPFKRYNTILPAYGCASVDSVSEGFGVLFFLAKDANGSSSVIMVSGQTFKPISTAAIDYSISRLSGVSTARGDLYQTNGEIFYQLSFSGSDSHTFVYHLNKDAWYELQMSNGTRHKMQGVVFFNNEHLFLGYDDNKVYRLDDIYLDNNGDAILCERITTKLSAPSGNSVMLNRVDLTFAQGVGNYNKVPYTATTAYDPIVYLDVSRDEGRSYGHIQERKIGASGQFRNRTIFDDPFGTAYSFTFRIRFYAKTNYVLTGSFIDAIEQEQ